MRKGYTRVDAIGRREGNEEGQVPSRAIYAVDTQENASKNTCGILPAINKMREDVPGIFVTPNTTHTVSVNWAASKLKEFVDYHCKKRQTGGRHAKNPSNRE